MDSKIDFSKFVSLPGVENIEQLVTTFCVSYNRAPKDLKVDVFKSLKNGMFTGMCNYAFWGPDQSDPYRNLNCYPSIEIALHSAISGFRFNDNPDYPNDLIFWRSDNGMYFDGDRSQVTFEEIQERRKNFSC